jgi:hypothetical protein
MTIDIEEKKNAARKALLQVPEPHRYELVANVMLMLAQFGSGCVSCVQHSKTSGKLGVVVALIQDTPEQMEKALQGEAILLAEQARQKINAQKGETQWGTT